MSQYAADHAGALADLTEAGASVTFTLAAPGAYDPDLGTMGGGTATTVTGRAIRVRGSETQYAALGITTRQPATLLVAPTTFGTLPALGSTVAFGGVTRTLMAVDPVAPDGTAILFRAVVAV